MKKFTFFVLTLSLFSTLGLIAQNNNENKNVTEEVPLKPLLELFTSATCGPCAYANPIFDSLLEVNPGTHSVIKYQTNFPGSGDPYYTEEVGVRTSYYNPSGVPSLYVNSNQMHPVAFTQEVYDTYQTNMTSMSIDIITAEIDLSNMLSVDVDINALGDYAAGLTAHVVVVEETTVDNTASNGELEFHYVMMKMLPDASGTTLPALTNGNTETLTFSFDMGTTFMETGNDLELIVFVQNDANKSIIQSEQGIIESALLDYTLNINVIDESSNPVVGAKLFLEGYGTKYSDAAGDMTYEGVLPGTYTYDIIASGLIPTDGIVDIVDQDVSIQIVMDDPGFYYYEDFTTEIPADYTVYAEGSDFLYWYDGRVIFFRQSGTLSTLMLVSELIDIIPGEKLWFDIGEHGNTSMEMIFGIITDPNDPETFIEIETITPTTEWETYEYLLADLPTDDTDIYFAWKHNSSDFSNFSLDNVKINYGATLETYEMSFQVFDGSTPVAGALITIGNLTETTNDNGSAVFTEILDGVYDYTVLADGYMAYEDQVEVAGGNVFEEVNLLIDNVDAYNLESLKIYPNPSSGTLNIQANEIIQKIEIFDLAGKILMNKNIDKNNCHLDLTSLNKGIYLVQIRTSKDTHISKIIIE